MDGPTWWNNRFWRPLSASYNGDARVQKTSGVVTHSGPPLTSWHPNNRRIVRHGFRTDIYRRESSIRPLGALRVFHSNRRSSVEVSGTLTNSNRSVSRPSSAAPLGRSTSITKQGHVQRAASSLEEVRQTSSSSKGGGEMLVHGHLEEIMQGSLNGNIKNEEQTCNVSPESENKTYMTFQQFQMYQSQQKTSPKTMKSASEIQQRIEPKSANVSQNNVVATRFGRRIVRPNSGGIITRVGELKLVDLEETLNIQSQPLTQPLKTKVNSTSETYSTIGKTPVSTPVTFVPNFTHARPSTPIISKFKGGTTHFEVNDSLNNSLQTKMSSTSITPFRSIFSNGSFQPSATEIISQPPKIALKSILKRSNGNIVINTTGPVRALPPTNLSMPLRLNTNDTTPILSETISTEGDIIINSNNDTNSDTNHTLVSTSTTVDITSVFTPSCNGSTTPTSVEKLPVSNIENSCRDDTIRNRMLMRRGMRSAPALKREVRFDIRNTDVFEFHPAESILDLRYLKG